VKTEKEIALESDPSISTPKECSPSTCFENVPVSTRTPMESVVRQFETFHGTPLETPRRSIEESAGALLTRKYQAVPVQ
jgi:hypothetical protein